MRCTTAAPAALVRRRPLGREPGVCRVCGNFGTGNQSRPCPACGRS
jgi:rubrerythrin